jgi:CubicO group peptidase (beta-lactamase class C family)
MTEMNLRGIDTLGARDAGVDPDGLRRAFALLAAWIEEGVLPGAAALVTRGGKVAGEAYLGLARRSDGTPVTSDTIWSLASVTKPFTATAVMLLVERGAIALDEPLFQLLPEFLQAPETPFDRRRVTLRHVLAHCSGLPGFSPDNLALRQAHRPLEDFVRSFGQQPLFFAPASAHLYSNPGILLAAEVVGRAVSGALGVAVEAPRVGHYHGFVHEEILAPLGMAASSLVPPAAWDERIARVEQTGQEGQDWEVANSAYYRSLGIPWGGLYSRPRDLARFVDLFLPTAAGRPRVGLAASTGAASPRLVSAATAAAMISVQFAPPEAPADVAPGLRESVPGDTPAPAVAWGIGWGIKGEERAWPSGDLSSPATYGHRGASGTMVWADPKSDVACILLTNRTLASGWTTERPRLTLFSNAVLASVR